MMKSFLRMWNGLVIIGLIIAMFRGLYWVGELMMMSHPLLAGVIAVAIAGLALVLGTLEEEDEENGGGRK